LPTYSNTSALSTSNGTADTENTTAVTIKVPGGSRLKNLKVMNKLGTGVVYQIRVNFTGVKSPQTYLMNQTSALEGTEVGSGKVLNLGVDVDIPVPAGVSEIEFFTKATVASQTYVIGLVWVGP